MLTIVTLYVCAGVAYLAVQAYNGAGHYLGRKMAEEARVVPPALIPLLGFIVTLIVLFFMGLALVIWPYFAWDDWRKGMLFNSGYWSDKE